MPIPPLSKPVTPRFSTDLFAVFVWVLVGGAVVAQFVLLAGFN